MTAPPLKAFSVENFKSIRKSRRITFGWLTVFIGNNGSGKSSLIEALESFRDIAVDGLDNAMRRWRGFEQIWNKAPGRALIDRDSHRAGLSHPMKFRFDWRSGERNYTGQQSITQGDGGKSLFIQQEQLVQTRRDRVERWTRNDRGDVYFAADHPKSGRDDVALQKSSNRLKDGDSLFKQIAWDSLDTWRFLSLNPETMGHPSPEQRATTGVQLLKDGSNIAEYLQEIKKLDSAVFADLLEAIRYVLPYATDLQPTLASELGREYYLRLREENFDVPGWLLSTGTLRVVALLACLRHPKPPPLLIIEEIENGLDPRTLNLIVEEIRAAISAKSTQIILTTHSPYLLDLLDLSHIVVVERIGGQPVFQRPDPVRLAEWTKSFSPGRLYTMGRLKGGE